MNDAATDVVIYYMNHIEAYSIFLSLCNISFSWNLHLDLDMFP
jgi:hypothetical protein